MQVEGFWGCDLIALGDVGEIKFGDKYLIYVYSMVVTRLSLEVNGGDWSWVPDGVECWIHTMSYEVVSNRKMDT